jgi:hypothetical protein
VSCTLHEHAKAASNSEAQAEILKFHFAKSFKNTVGKTSLRVVQFSRSLRFINKLPPLFGQNKLGYERGNNVLAQRNSTDSLGFTGILYAVTQSIEIIGMAGVISTKHPITTIKWIGDELTSGHVVNKTRTTKL